MDHQFETIQQFLQSSELVQASKLSSPVVTSSLHFHTWGPSLSHSVSVDTWVKKQGFSREQVEHCTLAGGPRCIKRQVWLLSR